MIYILEGPDGVGKSTLANAIYEQTKGHILHCTWKKEFDMQRYFTDVFEVALKLNQYQDVIIDRWAPSEWVYGNVFRGGPSFNVTSFVWDISRGQPMKFIMCSNENVVENHKKHLAERDEMFDDMTEVAKEFETFKKVSALKWIDYDYDKVDMYEFVKELVDDNKTN